MSDLPPPKLVIPPPPQPAKKSMAPLWILLAVVLAALGAWWIGERQADDRENGLQPVTRCEAPVCVTRPL
jgi:hypothetical protein